MPQSSSWEILRSPLFTRFSTKWPCINNWCKTEPFESASLWIMQHNQLQKQSITIYKHWFRIQLIQLRASNSFTKNFRQFWYCSLLGANQTLIQTIETPGFLMLHFRCFYFRHLSQNKESIRFSLRICVKFPSVNAHVPHSNLIHLCDDNALEVKWWPLTIRNPLKLKFLTISLLIFNSKFIACSYWNDQCDCEFISCFRERIPFNKMYYGKTNFNKWSRNY